MVNGICAIVYCNKEDASRNAIRVLDDFTTSQIYSLSLYSLLTKLRSLLDSTTSSSLLLYPAHCSLFYEIRNLK